MIAKVQTGDVMIKYEYVEGTYFLVSQTSDDAIKVHEEDYYTFAGAVEVAKLKAGKDGKVWDMCLKNPAKWRIVK